MEQELQKVEQQESSIEKSQGMKIPFAQHADLSDKGALEHIFNAERLDFNTAAVTWSPEEKGERKRLVFQGIKEKAKTKNKYKQNDTDADYVYLDKAVFVEIFKEGEKIKQRMIESYATVLLSYLMENNVPRHAIMDIEYTGKERGSQFQFDTFAINMVPVSF